MGKMCLDIVILLLLFPHCTRAALGQLLETEDCLDKPWTQLQVCTSTFLMGIGKDWPQQPRLQGKALWSKWSVRFVGEREEKNGFPWDGGDINSGDGAGARTFCSGEFCGQ